MTSIDTLLNYCYFKYKYHKEPLKMNKETMSKEKITILHDDLRFLGS